MFLTLLGLLTFQPPPRVLVSTEIMFSLAKIFTTAVLAFGIFASAVPVLEERSSDITPLVERQTATDLSTVLTTLQNDLTPAMAQFGVCIYSSIPLMVVPFPPVLCLIMVQINLPPKLLPPRTSALPPLVECPCAATPSWALVCPFARGPPLSRVQREQFAGERQIYV